MVTGLQKINPLLAYAIYQSMFLRHPARPATGQHILQWFRLSNATKWIAQYRLDKFEDAKSNLPVGPNPMAQILSKLGMKYRFPLNAARQVPSPGGVSPMIPACPYLLWPALAP